MLQTSNGTSAATLKLKDQKDTKGKNRTSVATHKLKQPNATLAKGW